LEARGVPQSMRPDLAAEIDALVMARTEVASHAAKTPVKPPLPQLAPKQIQAVLKRGEKRPWSARADDDRRSPFEWIRDNYSEWIPGLLQSHLRSADFKLWQALQSRISGDGMPDWLDLPSKKEAHDRAIIDPEKKARLIMRRQSGRESLRLKRASLP
jgi:hypothetical protein